MSATIHTTATIKVTTRDRILNLVGVRYNESIDTMLNRMMDELEVMRGSKIV
jgi:hypothetical protein